MEMDAAELTHAYIQDKEKVAIPVTADYDTFAAFMISVGQRGNKWGSP